MTTNFVPADVVVGTSRTLIYTCPGSTQSVLFSGTFSNIDNTNSADHIITFEVLKVDGVTYVPILNKITVPFGSSLVPPKVALVAGEKLYATADALTVLQARIALVEKS